MSANLIELLREARETLHCCDQHDVSDAASMRDEIDAALARAEAQPEAVFTMEQFGGLVGLARDHARERAVVYKATSRSGETCHFGVKSLARIWAKGGGNVEEVPVRDLRVVSAPQPAAPDSGLSADEAMRLIATVKYLRGIAERGEGRQMRDDETVEQFVLGYVKRLEQPAAPEVKP